MIYTVTMNPAVDKTAVIRNFLPGKTNRIETLQKDPGGKGLNVSKCIAAMGETSCAFLPLGGTTGVFLQEELLQQSLVVPKVIPISGETRTNLKIIDPVQKTNTDINEPGPVLKPQEPESLKKALLDSLQAGDLLILAGSLPGGVPASFYQTIIQKAKEKGIPTFLDTSGSPLKNGILAAPFLIKPNQEELSLLAGRPLTCKKELLSFCRELLSHGISKIVVSLGKDGAYFLSDTVCYRGTVPMVPVQNTVGAGDSMVAAFAYGFQKKMCEENTFRLALAFGSASVTCSGTEVPPMELVSSLYHQIHLETLC